MSPRMPDYDRLRAQEKQAQERDELARAVFIADNCNAPAGMMEKEWDENPTKFSYAHMIADGLIAAGYRKVQP